MFKVSFTGHRPEKLPFFSEDDPLFLEFMQRLRALIEKLIEEGCECFYTGMARGVDLWCAEIIIELKNKFPELKLTAVIPCKTQTKSWDEQSIIRYRNILELCDKRIYISENYTKSCMLKRDRALVELCDVLVAVFNGTKGGTEYTLQYANNKNKKVIIVSPLWD